MHGFVEYKVRKAGVPVVRVDPKPWRTPGQGCHICGHVARGNRRSQAQFSCRRCGYTTHADFNAALNIRSRARVNWPEVAGRASEQLELLVHAQSVDGARYEGVDAGDKPLALAMG